MRLVAPLALLAPALATVCNPGWCFALESQLCQPSLPGTRCAECRWSAWLAPNGSCIPNLPHPLRSCSAEFLACRGFPDAGCVPSTFGVRCEECDSKGFIEVSPEGDLRCHCYTPHGMPNAHCASPLELAQVAVLDLNATATRIRCDAFQDHELGCFADALPSTYGEADPRVPDRCCTPIYGPPPGQLVEDGTAPWQECNTFGTWDPNEPFALGAFRTCSGHGAWDRDAYHCRCDAAWSALPIGLDFHTQLPVFSCRTCFGFFGPRPPLDHQPDETDLTFCSAPYTPDEYGEQAECGGHGDYQSGICICHASELQGYWKHIELSQVFERVLGNGSTSIETITVQTCSACADPRAAVSAGCPLDGGESRPLFVASPTVAPASFCTGCVSFGRSGFFDAELIDLRDLIFNDTASCCSVEGASVVLNELRIRNGTCIQTEQFRRYVGARWCNLLPNCRVFTAHQLRDEVRYRFTNSTDFRLVLSAMSESGEACAPTASPVQPTTPYPSAS